MKYKIQFLDVWGNEEDGWEVNAAYTSAYEIEVEREESDESIIDKLYQMELLSEYGKSVAKIWDFSDEFFIVVEDGETGEPLFNLVLEE